MSLPNFKEKRPWGHFTIILIPIPLTSLEITSVVKSLRNSEPCNRVWVLKQAKRSHIGSKCLVGKNVGFVSLCECMHVCVCVLGSCVLSKWSMMCISAVAVEIMRSYFLTSYQRVGISSSCKNTYANWETGPLTHTHTVNRHTNS